MKKVYLITFHGSVNYGAVLQAYALYTKICELGYDAEVIDYNRERHHRNYLRIPFSRNPITLLRRLIKQKSKLDMHRKFDRFSTERMKLTENSYNGAGSLFAFKVDKDAVYLVGSDQVWNCGLTGNDLHYFLDFVDSSNKYSYGSSFGVSDVDEWTVLDKVKELLKQFKCISVREESGANIIHHLIEKPVAVVCDPTFLLSQKQWKRLAVLPSEAGYVLLFMLSYSEELIRLAKETAKKKNTYVINIVYTAECVPGINNVRGLSPEEWLGYISNAAFVFTNSFHGFALSLIFNKQVWVKLTEGNRNSRITDLANRYGVNNHIIIDGAYDSSNIDYSITNKLMEQDYLTALQYLEDCLDNGEKSDK